MRSETRRQKLYREQVKTLPYVDQEKVKESRRSLFALARGSTDGAIDVRLRKVN